LVGGDKGLGAKVGAMVEEVAKHVISKVIEDCGHFIPEEQPAAFVRLLQAFAAEVP
jgi:pimeloyl-ACP methyl ester carboxylesterase